MRRLRMTPTLLACLAAGALSACTKDAAVTSGSEDPVASGAEGRTTTASAGTAEAVDDGDPVPTVAATAEPVAAEGDNSARNSGDDEPSAVTADDQSNDRSDVETTRLIRRSLTQDDALSTYAHNVKIITQKGHVVLKGPVRTTSEKQVIEERARKVAGAQAVTSELVVTPN